MPNLSTKDRHEPEKERYCPNCGRYIGPVEKCPYCRTVVEKRREIVYVKYGSLVLGIIGLLVFHQVAMAFNNPAVDIDDISKTHNYAYVEIDGTVIGDMNFHLKDGVDPNKLMGAYDFRVFDEDGVVHVKAYEDAFEQMKAQDKIPTWGDRVTLKGTVQWHGEDRRIGLNSADQLEIDRPTPAFVTIEEMVKDAKIIDISGQEKYYEPEFAVIDPATSYTLAVTNETYHTYLANQSAQRFSDYTSHRYYEKNTGLCLAFDDFFDARSVNTGWGPIALELEEWTGFGAIPNAARPVNTTNNSLPYAPFTLRYNGTWGESLFAVEAKYSPRTYSGNDERTFRIESTGEIDWSEYLDAGEVNATLASAFDDASYDLSPDARLEPADDGNWLIVEGRPTFFVDPVADDLHIEKIYWDLDLQTEYHRAYRVDYAVETNKSVDVTWNDLFPFIPSYQFELLDDVPSQFEEDKTRTTVSFDEVASDGERMRGEVTRVALDENDYRYTSTLTIYTPFLTNSTALIESHSREIVKSDLYPVGSHDPFWVVPDKRHNSGFRAMHLLRQPLLEDFDWVRVTGLNTGSSIAYWGFTMELSTRYGATVESSLIMEMITIHGEKSPTKDEWPDHPVVGEVVELSGTIQLSTFGREPHWVVQAPEPDAITTEPSWRW